jgi:rod shape-determining protein MreC
MPLGTLDRTPPPFFRQGPSALSKLLFFAALALFLMVADSRIKLIEPLRQGLAVVLTPVQRALAVPVEMLEGGSDYLRGLSAARAAEPS